LHAVDLVDRALLQMILQVAADALTVEHIIDAERAAIPAAGPTPGAMQDLRRADRAGAEDDLAARASGFAALVGSARRAARPFDRNQPVDQHIGFEPQVRP
jgi:hypothetical protein